VPLEHLWATWRSNYVRGLGDSRSAVPDGEQDDGRSLFERILDAGAPDDETLIVHRGRRCFVLLNRFPYTAGHLMVLPNRAIADLEALDDDEHVELWSLVRDAVVALKASLGCDAVNVGLNLGVAAGGSQSDHLHVHCVPRWIGDANFVSVAAETRVLPVSLQESWERLRQHWPAS
jgi:diadenosine tetraphosphate (Ap4A) HIT family hydrolase